MTEIQVGSAQVSRGPRKIVIDPVTRVEGHGKVTIRLNEAGEVEQARFHIVEFRGFERFIQGRMYWEVPVIVQRLCGICPVSHHLCAAKAMDVVAGVDQLTPTAEKMRRLMHYGQILQSNAVNFFHLASPDLLLGFEAPVAQRNILGVIEAFPEVGKWAIFIRKFGQQVIAATGGGRRIHPRLRHPRRRQSEPFDRAPGRAARGHRPDRPAGAGRRWNFTNPSSTPMRSCTRPSRVSHRAT